MRAGRKVVVIGLDGFEPAIVDQMLQTGELPNLARLRASGGYARVATTTPAQTPVAWSTFATGVNPGGHGIYDFLRRDPRTYLPDLALNSYESRGPFLPPRAVNLRRGQPLWELLSAAGIPSVVLRCPCTYPPDAFEGRLLAGMGVPDIRGGLGTSTFYSQRDGLVARESEQVVHLTGAAPFRSEVIGPRRPRSRDSLTAPFIVHVDNAHGAVTIESDGDPARLPVQPGTWSDWLRLGFRSSRLSTVHGMVRFLLVALDPLELHASPVNFDPGSPPYPLSHPPEYASELARAIGDFHTTGMVEEHGGLSNGRFGEESFLAHCDVALRERERMLVFELERVRDGFLFCLFDTPDRLQHMFWRFRDRDHPANAVHGERDGAFARAIEEHYTACDAIVGRAMESADAETLFIVLSDHGFGPFQRGVHLNGWLLRHGLLALLPGAAPGTEGGDFFRGVDWGRTTAYALGIGSVYLNVRGRERDGLVRPEEADEVASSIAESMTGLVDDARGTVAIRRVATRRQLYSGPCSAESPDLIVGFNRGYRASWSTALGGVPGDLFEDNTRKWSGDHIVDPELVPGVLFMNRPFRGAAAHLVDMAPTILDFLGVEAGAAMEGRSILSDPTAQV